MPRHGVGLNDLLGAKEPGAGEALANMPKIEAGRPERAPRTFRRPSPKPPVWSERTHRKPVTASEAGKRNACSVCERAPQCNRRENAPTNQPKSNAGRSRLSCSCAKQNYKTLFCRLTPELSRPVAGRRTRASVAHSTRPTPRCGVGLNELLGGGGCRQHMSPADASESRSGKVRARPANLPGRVRSNHIRSRQTDRKPVTVSEAGNAAQAKLERAPRTWPKSYVMQDFPKSRASQSRSTT